MDLGSDLDENQMLNHIAARVERLLKADPDLLMSYLYRLDVEQKKIEAALQVSLMPVQFAFAKLIWDRQKERLYYRKKYKQKPIEGWEF